MESIQQEIPAAAIDAGAIGVPRNVVESESVARAVAQWVLEAASVTIQCPHEWGTDCDVCGADRYTVKARYITILKR